MINQYSRKLNYVQQALMKSGFVPTLKLLWDMGKIAKRDETVEHWNKTWDEAISYFRDKNIYRVSQEETKKLIIDLITNNLV